MVVAAREWGLVPELLFRCSSAMTAGLPERASANPSAAGQGFVADYIGQQADSNSAHAQRTAMAPSSSTAGVLASSGRTGVPAAVNGAAGGHEKDAASRLTPASGVALATALLCRLALPAGVPGAASVTAPQGVLALALDVLVAPTLDVLCSASTDR